MAPGTEHLMNLSPKIMQKVGVIDQLSRQYHLVPQISQKSVHGGVCWSYMK